MGIFGKAFWGLFAVGISPLSKVSLFRPGLETDDCTPQVAITNRPDRQMKFLADGAYVQDYIGDQLTFRDDSLNPPLHELSAALRQDKGLRQNFFPNYTDLIDNLSQNSQVFGGDSSLLAETVRACRQIVTITFEEYFRLSINQLLAERVQAGNCEAHTALTVYHLMQSYPKAYIYTVGFSIGDFGHSTTMMASKPLFDGELFTGIKNRGHLLDRLKTYNSCAQLCDPWRVESRQLQYLTDWDVLNYDGDFDMIIIHITADFRKVINYYKNIVAHNLLGEAKNLAGDLLDLTLVLVEQARDLFLSPNDEARSKVYGRMEEIQPDIEDIAQKGRLLTTLFQNKKAADLSDATQHVVTLN